VGKQYQTRDAEASMAGLAVPDEVTVALAAIAESANEGLLALAVGAGLQVMQTLMEESVVALAGPKGRYDPDRTAVRHGHEPGSVTLGGRRVAVQRPRVRAADGSGELPVGAYQLFSGTELLGRLALERMLVGCPRAAMAWAWSRSAPRWSRPRRAPASRRSRGGLSP
jgi:putative transposase